MDFLIKTHASWPKIKSDCLVIPVYNTQALPPIVDEIDPSLNGQIRLLEKAKKIATKPGQVTTLFCPENKQFQQVILVACEETQTNKDLIAFFNKVYTTLKDTQVTSCALFIDALHSSSEAQDTLSIAARTLEAAQYQYDTTLTKKAPKTWLKKVFFVCDNQAQKNTRAITIGKSIAQGMTAAKQLGNLPANICTPGYLAKQAEKLAQDYPNLKTQILSETQLKKLRMGALMSVTAGTEEPAKVIIMNYTGAGKTSKPTVLVGKGVTFDSGGISLKPGPRMDEMKFDMCGAASVFGTIQAVAALKLKINVVGIVGAVENLPSGKATKPGDVITSMSGQTIEVLNTDAEGRLVLCDLLTYAERFKPKAVIDIATLTGACVVALGHHASGLYANDETLLANLKEAGDAAQDRAWPMPLWDDYNQLLKSKFADMGNIGGPTAGSITAACFLSRFCKDYKWAHLDIAGSAWQEKMASGRPVGLLTQYLIDHG